VHSAAIFVFVGVDSDHFRYVRDFEVVVQGLVGDVPGGTADHSEHAYINLGIKLRLKTIYKTYKIRLMLQCMCNCGG